jgi:hypothetical protein
MANSNIQFTQILTSKIIIIIRKSSLLLKIKETYFKYQEFILESIRDDENYKHKTYASSTL